MGIRIQPLDIAISTDPDEDPFENDKLERRELAETLTPLIRNIEGPCAMALDAHWGTGKTTFLRLWTQYLRNGGFTVIRYNAWETDFCEDPFVALCAELTGGVDTKGDPGITDMVRKVRKNAQKVIQHAAWNSASQVISHATIGAVNINKLRAEIATDLSPVEERLNKYRQAKAVVSNFKDSLEKMAEALSGQEESERPLVVMIDELDRCRPSYAVELLETAKHLFSVNKVVFVLAVNRDQLVHSVKALYGNDFDANGYLRRFFDVDVRLPVPDRKKFINNLYGDTRLEASIKEIASNDPRLNHIVPICLRMFLKFFGASNLSLRDIAQAIHRLGLVIASLDSDLNSFFVQTALALILRTLDEEQYRDFVAGKVSDLGVVDATINDDEMKALQRTDEGQLFEASLIMAYQEIKYGSVAGNWKAQQPPLLQRYRTLQDKYNEDIRLKRMGGDKSGETTHAIGVLRTFDMILEHIDRNSTFGFKTAVNRLELLVKEHD